MMFVLFAQDDLTTVDEDEVVAMKKYGSWKF